MSSEKVTKEGLKELDDRLQKRKFLFRVLLIAIVAVYGWKLYNTPFEFWRPIAGLLGLAYAAGLHGLFYLAVAPWIGRMEDSEKSNKMGFLSSWVYLFFLLGPLFLGSKDFSYLWFRMGFIAGYAVVFAQYGTYFELARKTWMKPSDK